jgi:uncharacterized protein YkwD
VSRVHLHVLLASALLVSCEAIDPAFSDDGGSTQSPPDRTETGISAAPVTNRLTKLHAGQALWDATSPKWKKNIVDTTANAEYLTELEKQVIVEVNLVRTDPPEYARRYLVPLRSRYHDKVLHAPGDIAITTKEGIGALDECTKELQAAKPLSPLSPRKGLALAARDQARDQAKTGATGHTGSDRSTTETRLDRYGKWDMSFGENIDYGNGDARRIVTSLLVDDGVPSRGHRKNLLSGAFKVVGVSVGPHLVYRHMCVMDFAGAYR